MPTGYAYSSGHLVLSHFGTCMCSYVETNLFWTCLVSGLLNFEHPSVLFFCFWLVDICIYVDNTVEIAMCTWIGRWYMTKLLHDGNIWSSIIYFEPALSILYNYANFNDDYSNELDCVSIFSRNILCTVSEYYVSYSKYVYHVMKYKNMQKCKINTTLTVSSSFHRQHYYTLNFITTQDLVATQTLVASLDFISKQDLMIHTSLPLAS